MSDRITDYAEAVIAVGRAEGDLDAVTDELRQLASAVEGNAELRDALTDPAAPVGQRLALLETKVLAAASNGTRAAVAMLIASGNVGDMGEVATAVGRQVAAQRDRELAEVRVAVPLDDARREQLRTALEAATGKQLELQVVVDPGVVGGVRVIVGDTVYDGSLSRRMDDLRTAIGA